MLQTVFKSPYLKCCGLKSKSFMYFIFLTYQNLKPTTSREKKNQMKKFNFQLASVYLVYSSTLGLKQNCTFLPSLLLVEQESPSQQI